MNKGELIDAVARNVVVSKALTKKVLNSVIDTVTKSLKEGG